MWMGQSYWTQWHESNKFCKSFFETKRALLWEIKSAMSKENHCRFDNMAHFGHYPNQKKPEFEKGFLPNKIRRNSDPTSMKSIGFLKKKASRLPQKSKMSGKKIELRDSKLERQQPKGKWQGGQKNVNDHYQKQVVHHPCELGFSLCTKSIIGRKQGTQTFLWIKFAKEKGICGQ